MRGNSRMNKKSPACIHKQGFDSVSGKEGTRRYEDRGERERPLTSESSCGSFLEDLSHARAVGAQGLIVDVVIHFTCSDCITEATNTFGDSKADSIDTGLL